MKSKRGQDGFGSLDMYWVQSTTSKIPNIKLLIEEKILRINRAGADVTIIRGQDCLLTWPLSDTLTHL